MRPLLVTLLLVLATACNNSTGPEGTVIRVRLLDDSWKSAGRNLVFVTLPSGERLETRTGMDGIVDIKVAAGGQYRVRVIPRAGYVPSEALSKDVVVDELGTATLQFVLYREGYTGAPWEGPGN